MASEVKNQLLNELAYETLHYQTLRSNEKEIFTMEDLIKHELEISTWAERIKPLIDLIISYRPNLDFISKEISKVRDSFHEGIPEIEKCPIKMNFMLHKKKLKLYSDLRVLIAALRFGKRMIHLYV